MTTPTVSDEARWLACSRSPAYFLDHYGYVYDAPAAGWTRFRLWPAQVQALAQLAGHRLAVVLKARQLGMSWLTVGFGLWQMLFRPAATVLLFSQRDDEAVQLLNFRLRGMYDRLPPFFRARAVVRDNAHEFRLSNGSAALAFPTTGGRSYTATLAIVDEADHTDDLDRLLNAVKPTIDAGGRLVLLSTVGQVPARVAVQAHLPGRRGTRERLCGRSSSPGMGTPAAPPSGTPSRRATSGRAPAGWTTCTRSTRRPTWRRWPRARWTSTSRRSGWPGAMNR